jgi:hypothetical protein
MERDTSRSGTSVTFSPWAQLVLIAAAFCLGRESLPFRFATGDIDERPPENIRPLMPRPPLRFLQPRQAEVASLAPAVPPAARPPRPRVRTRLGPPPNRGQAVVDAPIDTEGENPPYPVLSRVFFGVEPSDATPPKMISGPDLTYTGAALDHEVEGVMRVACVVTVVGEVDRCRVLHGLPYMDVAVLQALRSRRYEPARLPDGRPVETEYVFVVRLLLNGGLAMN